ncbi:Uu.00g052600.m01.CDS01 [Anthostomella pinea]|uniref:Uu.00g052600.m01.CDS01 n=1 Tax=Anthostomella pinea TaxID=933095 RepID=A0AAI8YPH6_9PEZI|nr:Uu.00g052600.m01.CDS01 [Anthostomella pinea]
MSVAEYSPKMEVKHASVSDCCSSSPGSSDEVTPSTNLEIGADNTLDTSSTSGDSSPSDTSHALDDTAYFQSLQTNINGWMMATEAAKQPVDVSAPEPSLNQPTVANSESHDVDPSSTSLNGSAEEIENKQITDLVDELVVSAEASVSGGSDTETSKAGRSKALDDNGHVRTSSMVKPPQKSFKSVSVNRNFLGSKTAASATSRPESAAGSPSTTPQPTVASSASRLKLVAKSGSNLSGSTKTLTSNGKPNPTPNASSVWNRNQAPVVPEPKKLSDEDLKAGGIHMAARLGPEDLKGQSNWADIEDDDDDWAPATLTWNDGTSITLPQAEEPSTSPVPVPAAHVTAPVSTNKEPAPPSVNREPIASQKPVSPAPTFTATRSPSVKPSVLGSGKGLVLKGAQEKPTLIAKPPAPPTPVKSPWASLPPVERAPPVVMELPNQMQPPRYPLRDASNTKNATLPPAAKELAADDFSRSARDGSYRPRQERPELFNSQSGRYEPVAERRGSRVEQYNRHPAVLQRPPFHDQDGPAEPSAAFQTSRSGGVDGPYGRRRGSSNVSGGSGSFAHRMGAKPHDMLPPPDVPMEQGRSGSIAGGPESPMTAKVLASANTQPTPPAQVAQPLQPLPSPGQVQAALQPQQVAPEVAAESAEDIVNRQKEIMKTRREAAIRRRIEEEKRADAAKQERIRKKLEEMGPAPERKSAKTTKKEEVSASSHIVQRSDIPAALAAQSGARPVDATAELRPVEFHASKSDSTSELTPTTSATTAKDVSDTASTVIEPAPRVNGGGKESFKQTDRTPRAPSQPAAHTHAHTPSAALWSDTRQQPEHAPSWATGSQASKNVWGAPGDRSLGNGTFNSDIGALPGSHPAPAANKSHRPTPIAPPRSVSQGQVKKPEPQPSRLAPIGPPASSNPANAWRTFDIKADDARKRQERQEARGNVNEIAPVSITDTWRSVDLNNDGKRTEVGTFTTRADGSSINPRKSQGSEPTAGLAEPRQFGEQTAGHPKGPGTPGPPAQARSGSRFFPAPNNTPAQVPLQEDSRTRSPTPPPPTADGHPVYDGDVTRPHVTLPPQRPRVRLPPSAQPAGPGPVAPPKPPKPVRQENWQETIDTFEARTVSRGRNYGGIPQRPHEIASQENWQEKINNLMVAHIAAVPARAMPVDSSSIPSLEHGSQSHDSATVSLPGPSPDTTITTSREMAETFLSEQEMGSLPIIHLPANAPRSLWQPARPNWNPTPARMRVNPVAFEAIRFPGEWVNGRQTYRVLAPGMTEAKTVTAPSAKSTQSSKPPTTNSAANDRSGNTPRRPANTGGNAHRHGPNRHHSHGHNQARESNRHTSGNVPDPSGQTRWVPRHLQGLTRPTATASAAQS